MSVAYFVGVDVGTGSARAALVQENGKIIKTAVEDIQTWNPQPDFYEQSSENIWNACIKCIKIVIEGVNSEHVKGIGFDATCSLVALDKSGKPLSVSPSGNDNQNVILWLDHRASLEAEKINQQNNSVLRYVGGKISLEMETPKLLWLKNNLKQQWDKAGLFFDLPDFLTWRATCSETRSLCSLVCKWTYEITTDAKQGWNLKYFKDAGLEDLQENNWSKIGNDNQNVILWLDHRASLEAEKINQQNNSVLRYVGGKISLEMETPKLLWLKNNLKQQWDKAGLFFDLPDFLTWRATCSETRSLCSLVCKWTYEITTDAKQGWNLKYFKDAGLEDLQENNWSKIGNVILPPGSPVGHGLSVEIAKELGLNPGTPVGASIIDAHAGGLGLVGCHVNDINPDFTTRLSLICGTSTCHMAVSKDPVFTPGIWGPYFSAMVPGMWLNEGGQSATGKLLDHVIASHPATTEIQNKIGNMHIQIYLSNLLKDIAKRKNVESVAFLTKEVHVWPDFHGNRSPIADPALKGTICGLTLAQDEESLAILYLATVQALAYGTRHILDTLLKSGYKSIESILICGGLSKNLLFTQTQADVVNLPVICPDEPESVLLGSAILGACAAKHFKDMTTAIQSMGGTGKVVKPDQKVVEYHSKKYQVFLKMFEDQLAYKKIMQ